MKRCVLETVDLGFDDPHLGHELSDHHETLITILYMTRAFCQGVHCCIIYSSWNVKSAIWPLKAVCASPVGARSPKKYLKWWFSSVSLSKKGKNYSTAYSRAVPHHSTDAAITSLTLLIGREAVLSRVYGRSWQSTLALVHMLQVTFTSTMVV